MNSSHLSPTHSPSPYALFHCYRLLPSHTPGLKLRPLLIIPRPSRHSPSLILLTTSLSSPSASPYLPLSPIYSLYTSYPFPILSTLPHYFLTLRSCFDNEFEIVRKVLAGKPRRGPGSRGRRHGRSPFYKGPLLRISLQTRSRSTVSPRISLQTRSKSKYIAADAVKK